MKATVLVLGTDHGFQRLDSKFTVEQHEAFQAFLVHLLEAKKISALAEENNRAALAEAKLAESTIEKIAREHGLPHLYCEPDREERSRLGIKQENEIRISAFFQGLGEPAIQKEINESMRFRERIWLERLLEWSRWPVLFVCGANHSLPFMNLLSESHVEAELVAEDWIT